MFSVVRESRVSGYPFLIPAEIYLPAFLRLPPYIGQSDSASRISQHTHQQTSSIVESDKLFFHLLLSDDREEPIIRTLKELVPRDGFTQSPFFG